MEPSLVYVSAGGDVVVYHGLVEKVKSIFARCGAESSLVRAEQFMRTATLIKRIWMDRWMWYN